MDDDEKAYGVICEWKLEGPLVMEGSLATYDEAVKRMQSLSAQNSAIRVAVFRAVYRQGNETLLPKEML